MKTKKCDFTDAQMMHKDNPETFYAPSLEELDNLNVGDIVKVCCHGERFWVVITEIVAERIKGTVDNDLIFCDLKHGDVISFCKKHVFSIYN